MYNSFLCFSLPFSTFYLYKLLQSNQQDYVKKNVLKVAFHSIECFFICEQTNFNMEFCILNNRLIINWLSLKALSLM